MSTKKHPLEGTGLVPQPRAIHWLEDNNYRALCEILGDKPLVAAWAFHDRVCYAAVVQVNPPLVFLSLYPINPNIKVRSLRRSREQVIEDFHRMNVYRHIIWEE
jgi:hypothetical protein